MFNTRPFIIRPANHDDVKSIRNLVQYGAHVHQHLDWRQPSDWIGHMPFFVMEWNYELVAALACSQDPVDAIWLRLFAVNSMVDVGNSWTRLWAETKFYFDTQRTIIAAIAFQKWFLDLLKNAGFAHIEDVILLQWNRSNNLPVSERSDVFIRNMTTEDLPLVQKIDQFAFDPLWRYSQELLEIALSKSAIATVAEIDGVMVGYQISTANASNGHLARLAVLPEWHGRGIGYSLVHHMLSLFKLWGTLRVTVNTQVKNYSSLALYHKAGFRRTDEIYPVYQYDH